MKPNGTFAATNLNFLAGKINRLGDTTGKVVGGFDYL